MAKRFITQKADWIAQHQTPNHALLDGAHIGKNHRLRITETSAKRHTTKVTSTDITVTLPTGTDPRSVKSQKAIKSACEKALLQEAEQLLPQRLAFMSNKHGIPYKSCTVKKLKSRWGACDNYGAITLNIYLLQLDWALIDYVLCHELAHTVHHHHQPSFWQLVSTLYPDYKTARKTLKSKPTDILPTSF
jgi:predicted metal-dependent hydrolase